MKHKELVVITGAGSGIGKATAEAFSNAGHALLLLDRSGKAAELDLPYSMNRQVDVTDLASFQVAVREAEAEFGATAGMINNAGMMLLGRLESQDPVEWKKMLDINILGVLHGIQCVLKSMMERKTGTIINISSIAGRKTFPNHAVYCATKFAVHALTENLREEVASSGVRCVTIAPGVVETGLLSHTTSSEIKNSYTDWKKSIGGGLMPKDVAKVVLFAYEQPSHVCLREIVIGPTHQQA